MMLFPLSSLTNTSSMIHLLTAYTVSYLIVRGVRIFALGNCRLLIHGFSDHYLIQTPEGRYVLRVYQAPRAMGRS